MKNKILIILLLVMAVYPVNTVLAEKVYDVRFTVHNLSNNSNAATGLTLAQRQFAARTEGADQVCIFCHTPHNATPSVPLWNKVYDPATASTYRLYTSSKSLSTTVRNSAITATSESMLCLSCHDGKTAVNVLHNSRVREGSDANGDAFIDFGIGFGATEPQAFGDLWIGTTSSYPSNLGAERDADGKIPSSEASFNGTNLTDDHPIGFSYQSVLGEAGKSSALHSLADAKANGLRFFGTNSDRVECSSCHNPHVYYGYGLTGAGRVELPGATQAYKDRTPFLVRDNNGSALCLGCHIK